LKIAVCVVPSTSFSDHVRHCPDGHDVGVFQM
jgi:hypothetical protein